MATVKATKKKTKKSVGQILRQARELLKDKKKWAKGALAKNCEGVEVSPKNPSAVSWCALGAIRKYNGSTAEAALARAAVSVLGKEGYYYPYPGEAITDVNDVRGHRAVMKMFDLASKDAAKQHKAKPKNQRRAS